MCIFHSGINTSIPFILIEHLDKYLVSYASKPICCVLSRIVSFYGRSQEINRVNEYIFTRMKINRLKCSESIWIGCLLVRHYGRCGLGMYGVCTVREESLH